MAYPVKVDKQGRVILPKEIRHKLGISRGGHIILKESLNKIYIQGKDTALEKRTTKWKRAISETRVKPYGIKVEASRWVSEEWAKSKLDITE